MLNYASFCQNWDTWNLIPFYIIFLTIIDEDEVETTKDVNLDLNSTESGMKY